MGIGVKISEFENSPEQDVKTFNKIFTDCPLNVNNYSPRAEVEIGPILGPEMRRELFVDGVKIEHTFREDFFLPLDLPTNGAVKVFQNKRGSATVTTITNQNLENLVIEEKEFDLEPIEYMMLQYLRGCQSEYHTQPEIAGKLKRSLRGIRNCLKSMEQKNIIKVNNIPAHHKLHISINEDWA